MSEPVSDSNSSASATAAVLRSMTGASMGEIELPGVFDEKPRTHLLYEVVHMQQATRRAGTHATKTRAFVSGGGKKPWRQKGTGRARSGSNRSPLWAGGATVFGKDRRDGYRSSIFIKFDGKTHRLMPGVYTWNGKDGM